MTSPGLPDGVSRETLERLRRLEALIAKWNPAINLVAKSTLGQVWGRHILDSAQLFRSAPSGAHHWVDLGSGGGFPGLVIATLATELRPDLAVTMVESDQRKAAFLRQASHELGLKTAILAQRIESAEPQNADILSARALADLPTLLAFSLRHLQPNGLALFMKGASWQQEVEQASKDWRFDISTHPSTTDPQGVILALKAIAHV